MRYFSPIASISLSLACFLCLLSAVCHICKLLFSIFFFSFVCSFFCLFLIRSIDNSIYCLKNNVCWFSCIVICSRFRWIICKWQWNYCMCIFVSSSWLTLPFVLFRRKHWISHLFGHSFIPLFSFSNSRGRLFSSSCVGSGLDYHANENAMRLSYYLWCDFCFYISFTLSFLHPWWWIFELATRCIRLIFFCTFLKKKKYKLHTNSRQLLSKRKWTNCTNENIALVRTELLWMNYERTEHKPFRSFITVWKPMKHLSKSSTISQRHIFTIIIHRALLSQPKTNLSGKNHKREVKTKNIEKIAIVWSIWSMEHMTER